MKKTTIATDRAPAAIGPYSQAVRVGDTVYLAGQIPLKVDGSGLVDGDMEAMVCRVFENLRAVAEAAGGSLDNIVKLNIYLIDLSHFALVNDLMMRYFHEPWPARAAVGVSSLPRGAAVEMDAVMAL